MSKKNNEDLANLKADEVHAWLATGPTVHLVCGNANRCVLAQYIAENVEFPEGRNSIFVEYGSDPDRDLSYSPMNGEYQETPLFAKAIFRTYPEEAFDVDGFLSLEWLNENYALAADLQRDQDVVQMPDWTGELVYLFDGQNPDVNSDVNLGQWSDMHDGWVLDASDADQLVCGLESVIVHC